MHVRDLEYLLPDLHECLVNTIIIFALEVVVIIEVTKHDLIKQSLILVM